MESCESIFLFSPDAAHYYIHSAKYPLSVVELLLEVFKIDLRGGYDIGCKFETTLAHSELGTIAKAWNYKALVRAFHGHAHNHLCQLSFLTTYVKGMDLKDLDSGRMREIFFKIQCTCSLLLLC